MKFLFKRKAAQHIPVKEVYDCKFTIKASTIPAPPKYDQLSNIEQQFFSEFEHALKDVKLSPYDITLTRLSSGGFNINHPAGYIGKINPNRFYAQYLGPRDAVKDISAQTLEECLEVIPKWIQTIMRYQNARKRALKI